jgi:hypothetical protein
LERKLFHLESISVISKDRENPGQSATDLVRI